MQQNTRYTIYTATALVALIVGMSLASQSAPSGHPLVRTETPEQAISYGGFHLSHFFGNAFRSILTSPDTVSRAFAPSVAGMKPVAINLPQPALDTVVAKNIISQFDVHQATSMKHGGKVHLSQIPYTGFDFGIVGNSVYWVALMIFAFSAAYLLLYSQSRFFRSISTVVRTTALRIDTLRGV